jgi:uncharacterized membrane protein
MKNSALPVVLQQTMIAASYVVLVFAFQVLSFETVQFRIAEVLLVLMFFNKKSIFGLTIGTFIANWLLSPYGIIDAAFGSLATFIACLLMILLSKHVVLALVSPAISNGLIIGLMIAVMNQIPFLPIFFFVFLGEAVVLYLLGFPLYKVLKKNKDFQELFDV